jgi:ABC-type uncharacterized transport system permease subunit
MPRAAELSVRVLLVLLGVLGLTVALVAGVVAVLGGSPVEALRSLHAGSVATPGSLAESLVKTVPLVFTGLSVAVAFRAGVWNIGAEGQLLIGMLSAAAAALILPPMPAPLAVALCLSCGAAGGAVWAAAAAALRLKRGVSEIISTIMLNFLAVYLIDYLVRGPMRDPTSANDWSPALPDRTALPRLSALLGLRFLGGGSLAVPGGAPLLAAGVDLSRLHLGALLALAAAPLVWVWLDRSAAGFRIRAAGDNPEAARTAGIPVGRTLMSAFLVSGALAGLAGGVEMLALTQRMYRYDPGSPGYGYAGIPVALLGQLHPAGVVAAAFFFGALGAGSSQMQRTAGVSAHVAAIVQAAVVLVLASVSLRKLRIDRNRPES